jgi:hypothetical protein
MVSGDLSCRGCRLYWESTGSQFTAFVESFTAGRIPYLNTACSWVVHPICGGVAIHTAASIAADSYQSVFVVVSSPMQYGMSDA